MLPYSEPRCEGVINLQYYTLLRIGTLYLTNRPRSRGVLATWSPYQAARFEIPMLQRSGIDHDKLCEVESIPQSAGGPISLSMSHDGWTMLHH